MEEKKAEKQHHSFWSFLSSGNLRDLSLWRSYNTFFFQSDYPLTSGSTSIRSGFTLIELLIVTAIVALLVIAYLVAGNPSLQSARAKDAQRTNDIRQLKAALDMYYDDHKCYPDSIPSGSWVDPVTGVVYMVKVPKDPDTGTSANSGYLYQVDKTDPCPQWNVLYTTYTSRQFKPDDCPLSVMTSCNYTANKACSLSGQVDCSYIANNPVTAPSGGSSGTCPPSSPKNYVKDSSGNCNVAPPGQGMYCIEQCN